MGDVGRRVDDYMGSMRSTRGSGAQGADRSAIRALDMFVVVRDANRAGSVVTDVIRFE